MSEESESLSETVSETAGAASETSTEKVFTCKYCGATSSERLGIFKDSMTIARHVRNECPKAPKRQAIIARQQAELGAGGAPRTLGQEEPPLFKRPSTPIDIMKKVLTDWEVDQRVLDRVLKMSDRAGPSGLHPTELRSVLTDMASGKTKKEIAYIVDDYYHGLLQSEDDLAADQVGGAYGGLGRRGSGSDDLGSYRFPSRRLVEEEGRSISLRGYGYEGGGRSGDVIGQVERMLRDHEERERKEKDQTTLNSLSTTITELKSEIKSLKENPPKGGDETPLSENPYVLALKMQHDQDREDMKDLLQTMKDERKDFRETVKEQEVQLRETRTRRSDSYSDDTMRLASEGLDKIASKEPVKMIVDAIGKAMSGGVEGQVAPVLEKAGPGSQILRQIPTEYLE